MDPWIALSQVVVIAVGKIDRVQPVGELGSAAANERIGGVEGRAPQGEMNRRIERDAYDRYRRDRNLGDRARAATVQLTGPGRVGIAGSETVLPRAGVAELPPRHQTVGELLHRFK
jgi:hypothetical protein